MGGLRRAGWVSGFSVALCLLSGCRAQQRGQSVSDAQNANIAALEKAYAAFNRNDIAATVEAMDPNVEWTEPPEFPGGGAYHGHEGVKAYLTQSRAAAAEVISQPEGFIVAGDKIVVFVHARVRAKGSSEWQDVRLADVYTFHNGKAVEMRAFADRQQALTWAGATQP
jgi:ketosteroid isomerase-like protein